MEFKLSENLLTVDEAGKVTGPMGPVLMLNALIKSTGTKVNKVHHMYAVQFSDERVHNKQDGDEGYTSYGTYVFVDSLQQDDLVFMSFIDAGNECVPAVLRYLSDSPDEALYTPAYAKEKFLVKPTFDMWVSIIEETFKKVKN